jgi:hypothetical protein
VDEGVLLISPQTLSWSDPLGSLPEPGGGLSGSSGEPVTWRWCTARRGTGAVRAAGSPSRAGRRASAARAGGGLSSAGRKGVSCCAGISYIRIPHEVLRPYVRMLGIGAHARRPQSSAANRAFDAAAQAVVAHEPIRVFDATDATTEGKGRG